MKRSGSKPVLVAGCLVILLVNVALSGAAAWNRRGEPEAELNLTERELIIVADEREERGGLLLSFRLAGQAPDVVRRASWIKRHELTPLEHPWLDRDKLRELGFAVDLDPTAPAAAEYYAAARSRRAYLALEFEGPAWERWLAEEERRLEQLRQTGETDDLADATALLALDRAMRSRLFPVDAGTDAEALRKRYPDRRRYVVVQALVRPKLVERKDDLPVVSGEVREPIPWRVNVPLKLRAPLEPFLPIETGRERTARERKEAEAGWPIPVPPRYRAEVAFGRRHEPWLVGVEALGP